MDGEVGVLQGAGYELRVACLPAVRQGCKQIDYNVIASLPTGQAGQGAGTARWSEAIS